MKGGRAEDMKGKSQRRSRKASWTRKVSSHIAGVLEAGEDILDAAVAYQLSGQLSFLRAVYG